MEPSNPYVDIAFVVFLHVMRSERIMFCHLPVHNLMKNKIV
jgi:hypothetical protein